MTREQQGISITPGRIAIMNKPESIEFVMNDFGDVAEQTTQLSPIPQAYYDSVYGAGSMPNDRD
jgi:hypothetical protein